MDAATAVPIKPVEASVANRTPQGLAEARRRRQVVLSRWENEGGSVAAPERAA